jgi:hypothetical protein
MCYSSHVTGTALNLCVLASGGFAKPFLKAAVSLVMSVAPHFPLFLYPSVRPSARIEQLVFRQTDFLYVLFWEILRIICRRF